MINGVRPINNRSHNSLWQHATSHYLTFTLIFLSTRSIVMSYIVVSYIVVSYAVVSYAVVSYTIDYAYTTHFTPAIVSRYRNKPLLPTKHWQVAPSVKQHRLRSNKTDTSIRNRECNHHET